MSDVTRQRYGQYDWDQPFDADEYRKSPKAITMLYESWLEKSLELEESRKETESLRQNFNELDKSKALLTSKLETSQKQRWLPFVLQFVAVIAIGLGVNIVSTHTNEVYGWLFIAFSFLLEIVAFITMKMEA